MSTSTVFDEPLETGNTVDVDTVDVPETHTDDEEDSDDDTNVDDGDFDPEPQPPPTDPQSGFTLIVDVDGVTELADRIKTSSVAVGLDTETTGLNPDADRIRLIQLMIGQSIVIIDVSAFDNPRSTLAPLLDALSTVGIVGHNLAFDIRFLAKLGFVPKEVFCTMLASQVLHAGERVGHKLGDG